MNMLEVWWFWQALVIEMDYKWKVFHNLNVSIN